MSVPTDLSSFKWKLFGCELSAADARNAQRFGAWCLVWALSFVAATFAFEALAAPSLAVRGLLVLVPTLIGLQAVRAYQGFLRDADELQRRIQLEGLAIGFGAGALFMMSYRLLERAGAHKLDLNDGLVVMMVAWALGTLYGVRKYS